MAVTARGAPAGIAPHRVLRYGAPKPRRTDPAADRAGVRRVGRGSARLPPRFELPTKAAKRRLGSDPPAGVSIVTAAVLGEYLAGALVVLMLSGGGALENYAVRRASSVLRALAQRMPSVAHRRQDGRVVGVPPADVAGISPREVTGIGEPPGRGMRDRPLAGGHRHVRGLHRPEERGRWTESLRTPRRPHDPRGWLSIPSQHFAHAPTRRPTPTSYGTPGATSAGRFFSRAHSLAGSGCATIPHAGWVRKRTGRPAGSGPWGTYLSPCRPRPHTRGRHPDACRPSAPRV